MSDRVLVTGASGFVGRALTNALSNEGIAVRSAMRQADIPFPVAVEKVVLPDLARPVDWRPLLDGIDIVIHLAGNGQTGGGIPDEAYDQVNRAATSGLAASAAAAGIRRLVFISSIRAVSGPTADHVLTEADPERPTDAYGRSKLAAEVAVRASGVPFTILRPVLTYGPGVKGNLATLIQVASSPWPLPFGAVTSQRSLLGLDNLIAAIRLAMHSLTTAGETYIVADLVPLTFVEILTVIRQAQNRPPRMLAIRPSLLDAAFSCLGRAEMWNRLGRSLVVDPAKLVAVGWRPTVDTRAGLIAMVQDSHRVLEPQE